MTRAPASARSWVHSGPASTREKSATIIPSSMNVVYHGASRTWPRCRNEIRRRANETFTDQSAFSREFLELPLGDRFGPAQQAHGEPAARPGYRRRTLTRQLGHRDRRREYRVDS